MKRRTFDLILIVGGTAIAILLVVLGAVMKDNASFAKSYVRNQLSAQKITFTPEASLNDAERSANCLVKYAGTPLDSGKKAECYANEYIALHMRESAEEAGYDGATYATLGAAQREAREALAAAEEAGDPTEPLQARLDDVNSLRDTMFRGESLRGLLLTSYGFSVFGEKGDLAATVCFLAAAVLALAVLAGLLHFFRTPADRTLDGADRTHDEVAVT
ncbi:MAG: hypothetical protein AB7Q42_24520 [Acidimicrobiia bacterium]